MLRVALFVFALIFCGQSKLVRKHTETGVIEYDDESKILGDVARRLAGSAGLTGADRQALLDKHNQLRSITALGNTPGEPGATDMLKLIWDPALEAVATNYAKKCTWNHNPNRASEYNAQPNKLMSPSWVGENLYMTSRNTGALSLLESGIQGWYDEYKDYTYSASGAGSCSGVCGHYTQVVWSNTMYVGCGYGICGPVSGSSFQTATLLVCNYLPGGNFNGRAPYAQGSACSACPAAQSSCQSGLCLAAGTGGGPSATPRPTTTTTTGSGGPMPTPRPTPKPTPKPTFKPTPKPTLPSGGGATKGDGSCNAGLTGTMGFYFRNSNANCGQYMQALIRFKPCVGQVVSCMDEPYPGYSAYRRVSIKWQLDYPNWNLGFSAWRNGIKSELLKMGITFQGAANAATPPSDTGALSTSSANAGKRNDPAPIILGVIFGVLAVAAIAGACFWYVRRQKQSSAEYRMMEEQRTGQYHPPTAPIIS